MDAKDVKGPDQSGEMAWGLEALFRGGELVGVSADSTVGGLLWWPPGLYSYMGPLL